MVKCAAASNNWVVLIDDLSKLPTSEGHTSSGYQVKGAPTHLWAFASRAREATRILREKSANLPVVTPRLVASGS
jgi:hypothetical protein